MFVSVEMLALVGVHCAPGAKLEVKTCSSEKMANFQYLESASSKRDAAVFVHVATFSDGIARATAVKFQKAHLKKFTLWLTACNSDVSICLGEFHLDVHDMQSRHLAVITTQNAYRALCVLQYRCTSTPFHACPVHVRRCFKQVSDFLRTHVCVSFTVQHICACERMVPCVSDFTDFPCAYP